MTIQNNLKFAAEIEFIDKFVVMDSANKEGTGTSNKSEFLLMFQMMQEQQRQYQEQQQQHHEAAERRFKLELEEIRQRAKEERFDMVRFMADLQLQGGKTSSSCSSPEAVQRKFRRLDDEALDLIQGLRSRRENYRPFHEIEVMVKAVEGAMNDLRSFVCEKVDQLEEEMREPILSNLKHTKELCLSELLVANSYISELKTLHEEEKHASCLPSGIIPPTYNGDPLLFPTFWDAFSPLIHENRRVTKFYKMSYLKSALKGAAAGALESYPTTAENYDAAVAALKKRFGRKQAIIRSHVQELLNGKKINHEPKQLRALLDKVVAKKAILERHQVSWDQVLSQIVEGQLSKSLEERWIRHISPLIEKDEAPSSVKLMEFLTAELAALEALVSRGDPKINSKETKPSKELKKLWPSSAQALVTQASFEVCVLCSEKHGLIACPKFKGLTPSGRLEELMKMPGMVCFKCLKCKGTPGHPLIFRKCSAKCGVPNCGKPHHSLLHIDPKSKEEPMKSNALIATVRVLAGAPSKFSDNELETLLPTALAKIKYGTKEKLVRVGFDSCSQKSFVTKKVVDDLGIDSTRTDFLNIEGFGGSSSIHHMILVRFLLCPIEADSQEKFHIEAHVQSGSICSPLHPVDFDSDYCSHLKGLKLADPFPRRTAKIDVLLGGRYYFQLMQGSIVGPDVAETAPYAIDTMFGWVLAGPFHIQRLETKESRKCMALTATDASPWSKLEKLLEGFWNMESIGLVEKNDVYTKEKRDAVRSFERSVSFSNNRYVVALPFKENSPELLSNYSQARTRLISCEKSLKRDELKRAAYKTAIEDYVKCGFARELTKEELKAIEDKPRYYVPHHPVFKESSSSTKVRIVFDASAKDPNGNSLNDCLLKGPNLLPDIAAVLLRFRIHKFALNRDLRKMFCQTAVIPDHQRYQLYLWRDCNSNIQPKIYAMQRMMFGVTSSPFLAIQSVLCHSLSDNIVSRYGTHIHDWLVQNMYMDDIHFGGDTVEEVVKMQSDLVDFFRSGGWEILKFASNSAEVLSCIPEEQRLPNLVLDFDNKDFGEAASLGLKWDTLKDYFYCKVSEKLLKFDAIVTKKSVLSKVGQIFDLFGFLAAFIIRAKILIQKLWQKKLSWDEPLPEDNAKEYQEWVEELSEIESIKVPRCPFLTVKPPYSIQIHGFCDASENAYAAVTYLRIESSTAIKVSYLMAKTRVAPVKPVSIPRLELMAAHSLAKLVRYVLDALKTQRTIDEVYLWSDSKIVLAWISKPSSSWKTFVKNRVQDIHDSFSSSVWGHCVGIENPADLHSRGMKLSNLKENQLYWQGPPWLSKYKFEWPSEHGGYCSLEASTSEACVKEAAKVKTFALSATLPYEEFFRGYSSYSKVVRLVARILRWRHPVNKQLDHTCRPDLIGPKEYKNAEYFLFSLVQKCNFTDDFFELQSSGKPSSSCRFKNMDPQFDFEKNLIIAGDRLKLSDLPEYTKYPIILPNKDLLVELLILHVHQKNHHSPQDTTIAILRERYHILHIREEVRRVCKRCVVCRHAKTKPLQQKMGILPEERVCPAFAFSDVGVDFTGPIYLKGYDCKTMRKAYICNYVSLPVPIVV